jgi:cytoskeletal protein CcmA (bactofilin family)
MFRKKRTPAIEATKLQSLVADNLDVNGDVSFTGGLRVDGTINGNVLGEPNEKSLLVLSEKGTINGRVRVYDAIINGTIVGDLEVEHFVELQTNARIKGNIIYLQLQLDCGATVDGQLVRRDENTKTPALPAPDKRNVVELADVAPARISGG